MSSVQFCTDSAFDRLHAWVTLLRCRDPDAPRGDVFDAWFNEKDQYPVSAKSGPGNTRKMPDNTTAKLAALHFYQLHVVDHYDVPVHLNPGSAQRTIWWNI